jgi:outer membrane murein-binding lipoprotein Lpp
MVQSHGHKEEDVRKLIAAAAILAVVFVLGCQDTQQVTELQGQLDKANQQITELTGQLQVVTAEKDSIAKVLMDMQAKKPATKSVTKPPVSKGTVKPPTKK